MSQMNSASDTELPSSRSHLRSTAGATSEVVTVTLRATGDYRELKRMQ